MKYIGPLHNDSTGKLTKAGIAAYAVGMVAAAILGWGTVYAANHLLSSQEIEVAVIDYTPTPQPTTSSAAPTQSPAETMGFTLTSSEPEGPRGIPRGQQGRWTVRYEADVIPSCDVDAPEHVDTMCKTYARHVEFGLKTDRPGKFKATLNLYVNASVR